MESWSHEVLESWRHGVIAALLHWVIDLFINWFIDLFLISSIPSLIIFVRQVEETVTIVEIDEETYEEVRGMVYLICVQGRMQYNWDRAE